jgi:hypothetical protein
MDDCDDLKTGHGLAERGDCWWTAQCSHRVMICRRMLALSAQLECIQAMLHFCECLFRRLSRLVRNQAGLASCTLSFAPLSSGNTAPFDLTGSRPSIHIHTHTMLGNTVARGALPMLSRRAAVARPSAALLRRGYAEAVDSSKIKLSLVLPHEVC